MHIDETELSQIERVQHGDRQAMQALIEKHRPLIGALAARLRISFVDKEALIQAGNIGLIQAAMHYVSDRETKLTTYAVPWILGEMKKVIRREASFGISLNSGSDEHRGMLLDAISEKDGIDIAAVDLRIALEKLAEDLRLVICLRYFRDMTQKETALLMKKSQTQISRMERRALDVLHAHLA